VGDTPIFGAGTYASERGAASATGHGEEIIKKLVAYHAVEGGEDPMKSARLAIGNIRAGVIVVNARGVGYAYNTEMMPLAVYDGERRRFVL
jgi:beta-aspartyl-peptidase (threonine type)